MDRVVAPLRRLRGGEDGFDRRLIAPMILGSILNPVNSSIIAVSLIPIGRAFGAPPAQTAWLISALYLATAVGQPVVGRLVDLYGPRKLFLIGTTLTGMAGLLGTLSPNLGVLIAARVILGFGTCAGYPASMYLLRTESERTGRNSPAGILTVLAVANQTIAVIGPSLGGLLIGLGGWRATFAVNIPLAIAAFVTARLRFPDVVAPQRGSRSGMRIDLPGIVAFAAMLVSMLLFLMTPRLSNLYLLAIAAAAALALVVRELRTVEPFIDLRVLGGNPALVATYLRTVLAATVSYCFLYGFTQWLEDGRGLSASAAGLVLLATFVTAILVSTTTGRRPQIRGKLIVGAVVQVAGCALMLTLHAHSALWMLIGLALVVGVPQGLLSLANQNAVYHQADSARMGSSAGLLRTFMYLGALAASSADGMVFGHSADTAGLHRLAMFTLVVSGLLLVLTVADRSLGRVGAAEKG
ncbi:MFS family permease [Nocardia sp. GAS34]|uniref:MFS transporter n=1 Tax=unclassified Nocardia TaxID=2637762 RepID=UPI003D1F3239